MPGYDRTGPRGTGPMTGGGFGFCNAAGGFNRQNFGRGYGRCRPGGRRQGRGFGPAWGTNWATPAYSAPVMNKEQEIEMLRAEAENLAEMMKSVSQRLESLEKEDS
ncbi:MAG: DUF5320 domain-containing protein [Desulfococcaceae bacterium]|nr:DUF5320 domain-containing protein [Desulfococcaceae bacterium]